MKEPEANYEDEILPEQVLIADDHGEDTDEETEPLPPRQERALHSVLTRPTLKEAALAAGCSDTTLWRYMDKPAFQRRLRRARRHALDHAALRVQRGAGDAVAVIFEIMAKPDASDSSRLSAARFLFENSFRVGEIEELKKQVGELEDLFRTRQEESDLAALAEEEEGEEL